jgi:hypothetical protein
MNFDNQFRKEVLEEYLAQVERISEACDWKTHFGAEEVVHMLLDIIEKEVEETNANS